MKLNRQGLVLLYTLALLVQNVHGSEIIHGKDVPDNLMLYMASVQRNGAHACGGFLIREDFVVTAAHCDRPGEMTVVLGTHNLKNIDKTTMRYHVTKCKHPNYINVTLGDDIMLLKLKKKAKLNQRVQSIKLPKGGENLKDKAKCRVAGWGFTKTGGESVDKLKYADVSLVNLGECKKRWNIDFPNNVTCAGGYKTKKGFCQGDSGGPLVYGGMAIGIVSFNSNGNCDYPNRPNVYTDLTKYLPWIKEILNKKKC